jgi:hypothetical protein
MARPEVTSRKLHAINADDDDFLNSAQVKHRYGGVSEMWLHRRLHDDSGFPAPDLIVNSRRFWRRRKLVAWERRRAAAPQSAPRPARSQRSR